MQGFAILGVDAWSGWRATICRSKSAQGQI